MVWARVRLEGQQEESSRATSRSAARRSRAVALSWRSRRACRGRGAKESGLSLGNRTASDPEVLVAGEGRGSSTVMVVLLGVVDCLGGQGPSRHSLDER